MLQRLLSTRGGTLVVGGLAALAAGAVLLVFVSNYRDSVKQSSEPVTVLVAKDLIAKGTPGDQVAAQRMVERTDVQKDKLKDGAIDDPSVLKGRVAVDDIYPGQQLTAGDFSAMPSDALNYKLTGTQRAVAVPLDSAHGLVGYVKAGDHVDVLAGFNVKQVDGAGVPVDNGAPRPVLKAIVQNVPVLQAPASAGGGLGSSQTTQNVVLEMTDKQAWQLAFASDNGKVWVVLRPQAGAKQTHPSLVTLETELLGVPSVTVLRSFGGRP